MATISKKLDQLTKHERIALECLKSILQSGHIDDTEYNVRGAFGYADEFLRVSEEWDQIKEEKFRTVSKVEAEIIDPFT